MKKLLFVSLALLATVGCKPAVTISNIDCSALSSIAGTTMQKRQDGIKLADQLAVLSKGDERTSTTEIIEAIVVAAYTVDRFHGKENQDWAVQAYSEQVYVSCYKMQNK